ncbi:CheR family methyltransferase [Devosia sp. 63-57]|uniref:CheR family methyltransferase n=1 Tax=Devosia sp. 63-57 TaxID=1895751 RepID=UPI00086C1361|nr:CheR family methyltransferase [Devosia sp. 63-57]ODT50864.1 MAG: chemotaxis protein CheR [Pelagibacterium sp. SCN 63-126]ODU86751.1 MAG: chemotaxis protein CheR [Pelagibacterium sp. SCN 63-17]OJX44475.1 MAG: chemotaxis protein CheR [Devosia sp. 63-57]
MPFSARLQPRPDDDDHLSLVTFNKIATLIGQEVGIRLPPAKRLMIEGRLRKRVRALGLDGFEAYGKHLFREDGLASELPYLINAVTTNKTDFFREPEHFELMEKLLVPTLIAERKSERNPLIKVWSAASSTGAEAYTIAMVMADLAAQRRDFRFAVLGTDISTDVLDQGRAAIYPAEQIAPVPQAMQSRHLLFSRRPGIRPEVRIAPELRRLVQFRRLNLMDGSYPFDRDVDIIFLRNVLIYFDKADQSSVISRLIGHLRPGGYLLLGHSESMIGTSITMRQVAPAVFQKV